MRGCAGVGENKLTSFDGAKTLRLPSLEHLKDFFDSLLQAQPLPVQLSHADTIYLVCLVRFVTQPDIQRLAL